MIHISLLLVYKVLLFLGAISAILLLWVWHLYNLLIHRRNQVLTDLSDINIQLKRKADLVDRLVQLVKEYAKHEKETFENVTKARSALAKTKGAQDATKADNLLTDTLRSIMLVVENYPKLQASKNFQELRDDLKELEQIIARYREEYNLSVQQYNNTLQVFPNVLLSHLLGFRSRRFFQVKEA